MKENTDLKVDRITLHKELARCKKMLTQAERDVEAYKRHVEEVQEKAKRRHADESLKQELENLKGELVAKGSEISDLRQKLGAAEGNGEELEKVKGDIIDLEADLCEKDRLIDERDDQIDRLKEQVKKDSDELDDVYVELEVGRRRIEDLERQQEVSSEQAAKLREAQNELKETLEAKQKVEGDLDEVCSICVSMCVRVYTDLEDSSEMKCLISLSTPGD